jgi:hypothetical protein
MWLPSVDSAHIGEPVTRSSYRTLYQQPLPLRVSVSSLCHQTPFDSLLNPRDIAIGATLQPVRLGRPACQRWQLKVPVRTGLRAPAAVPVQGQGGA